MVAVLSLWGDSNDTVTITDGAYNTTISLGAGDDVFDATSGVMGILLMPLSLMVKTAMIPLN